MVSQGYLPTVGDKPLDFYADKFCFDYAPEKDQSVGTLNATVSSRSPGCRGLKLALFDDEKQHWLQSEHSEDCQTKLADASWVHDVVFRADANDTDGSGLEWAKVVRVNEHVRPRLWRFVFLACNATAASSCSGASFRLHATNGDSWQREFPVDETGLWWSHCSFFCFASLLLGGSLASLPPQYLRRQLLQLLFLSVALCVLSGACMWRHYSVFAANGVGSVFFQFTGALSAVFGRAVVLLVLALVARGSHVLHEDNSERTAFLVSVVGIILLSAACEFHRELTRSSSSELYLYESRMGLMRLFLNFGLLLWLLRSLMQTSRRVCSLAAAADMWEDEGAEGAKALRRLYSRLMGVTAVWLLWFPTVALLAYELDPWVRERLIARAELLVRLGIEAALIWLLWPSKADPLLYSQMHAGGYQKFHDDDMFVGTGFDVPLM